MTQQQRTQEFANRLDSLMSELDISGYELGDRAGINQTTITRARRGALILSRELARRIAEVLDQPYDYFDDLYLPDDLEDEEWRPLKKYPEYIGSSKGRIMNPNTGRIMKASSDKYGRPKVQLHINGKPHTARVQDLIDETFDKND